MRFWPWAPSHCPSCLPWSLGPGSGVGAALSSGRTETMVEAQGASPTPMQPPPAHPSEVEGYLGACGLARGSSGTRASRMAQVHGRTGWFEIHNKTNRKASGFRQGQIAAISPPLAAPTALGHWGTALGRTRTSGGRISAAAPQPLQQPPVHYYALMPHIHGTTTMPPAAPKSLIRPMRAMAPPGAASLAMGATPFARSGCGGLSYGTAGQRQNETFARQAKAAVGGAASSHHSPQRHQAAHTEP